MRWLPLLVVVSGCASAGIEKNNPDGNNPGGEGNKPPIDAPNSDTPQAIDAAISQTLVQTTNSTNTSQNSATCSTGENSWYRVFPLSDFGITGPFFVTQVTFGAQEAAQAPVVQIKIGTYSGTVGASTLNLAQVTNINSTTLTVPNETDPGTNLVAPITGTIPAGSNLIVEVFNPSNTTTKFLYIGASSAGETKPGYVRGPDCAVTAPTSTPAIGFPASNLNITVTGTH